LRHAGSRAQEPRTGRASRSWPSRRRRDGHDLLSRVVVPGELHEMNHRTATIAIALAAATVAGLGLILAHRVSPQPLQPIVADASPVRHDQAPTVLDDTPPPSVRATVEPDPGTAAPEQHALTCNADREALWKETRDRESKLVCRVDFDELLKQSRMRPSQPATMDAVFDRILLDALKGHAQQVLETGK